MRVLLNAVKVFAPSWFLLFCVFVTLACFVPLQVGRETSFPAWYKINKINSVLYFSRIPIFFILLSVIKAHNYVVDEYNTISRAESFFAYNGEKLIMFYSAFYKWFCYC